MIDWSNSPTRVFDLYVKLSAWLIPTFLVSAFVGLQFLSQVAVSRFEDRVAARVTALGTQVAGSLAILSAENDEVHVIAIRQIMQALLADPAIQCAELRGPGGPVLAEAPLGLGCAVLQVERRTTVPLRPGNDQQLEVGWSEVEVREARQAQREISMVILLAGLIVALLTNWLAFRVIIGRPLNELIGRIDQARNEAEHNAFHDSLTGLANRRRFDVLLDSALSEARRAARPVTVMHLDLDGFKAINDTLGHAAGDEVLTQIADLLVGAVTAPDLVARMGGDEFVILLGAPSTEARATATAQRIIEGIGDRVSVKGVTARVGTSIGIATVDPVKDWSHRLPERLLADADIALYQAKDLGRGQWVVCSDQMRQEVKRRKSLAEEIEAALAGGQFVVHYQPQFDGQGVRLMGVEALVRWNHPKRGLLMPAKFVEVAEELNLVDRIDGLVFQRAVADLRAWDAARLTVPRVSVNVSARRLNTPDLIAQLKAVGPPRGRLVFEVLESVYLDKRSQHMGWNLDALKDLGIEVEIDDFGTGHASISSVLAIHPARLKVAREIIQAFADEGGQSTLVQAVVALGRSMSVGLIAEGVETQAQLRAVRAMGFDMIQGFALAEPMPAREVAGFLERHRARSGASV